MRETAARQRRATTARPGGPIMGAQVRKGVDFGYLWECRERHDAFEVTAESRPTYDETRALADIHNARYHPAAERAA
jgi:hypothetical protein